MLTVKYFVPINGFCYEARCRAVAERCCYYLNDEETCIKKDVAGLSAVCGGAGNNLPIAALLSPSSCEV